MLPVGQWRLTTGGVPAKLISRTGSFSREQASAVEQYIIQAQDLEDFLEGSFPAPFVLEGVIVYPGDLQFSGFPTLRARDVSFESLTGDGLSGGKPVDPFGADSPAPNGTYEDFVVVTINFGVTAQNDASSPDQNNPLTFLEISAAVAGTFLSTPVRGTWNWSSTTLEQTIEGRAALESINNDGPDVPFTVPEVLAEISMSWRQIPFDFFNDVLVARMRDAAGKVNSAAMPTINNSPAETVLFTGYTRRDTYTWRSGFVGKTPIDVEMKFLQKNMVVTENRTGGVSDVIQVTHNHFYRPERGWRRLTTTRGGVEQPVYELADLNLIFIPSV